MRKKIILNVISMLMIMNLLAACTSKTEEVSTEGSTDNAVTSEATTDASTEESKVGGDLVLWLPPFAGNDAEVTDQEFWLEQLQPLIDETGCTVSIEIVPWDSYETKYLTGVSSGEGPDIGYMYMEMFSDYIDMGALADIDAYFTTEEKEKYYYYTQGNFSGTQYALPIVVGNPRIFVANMDILNAAGVTEVPNSLGSLLAAANAVAKNNADVVPFTQSWGDSHYGVLNENFWPIFWAYGGSIVDENGDPNLNTEAGIEAAQFIYDLRFTDNVLTDAVTSLDSDAVFNMLESGQLAMAIVSSNEGAKIEEAGLNWDYATYLAGPDGDGGTFVAADSLVMFENSKNKDLAAKAMKIMTSGATMEAFHDKIYNAPPISNEEEYKDLEVYKSMYENDTEHLITLPVFKGASSLYDTLYKNIQSMLLGDMTAEEVMQSTMDYYNSSIKE
jgi:multiple sugar transport system substrate-binding protein